MTLQTTIRAWRAGALAGAAALAAGAFVAPADAATPCTTSLPGGAVLASPPAGSGDVSTTFNTIYVTLSPEFASALVPGNERVLLVDDGGFITEGGVLHSATSGDLEGATVMETWVPALNANTRYTAQLARLDEHNCVDVTLGAFLTGPAY